MAWCVPGCVDGDDAGRDFITGPDAGRASFNGLEDAPCTSRNPLHRSGLSPKVAAHQTNVRAVVVCDLRNVGRLYFLVSRLNFNRAK